MPTTPYSYFLFGTLNIQKSPIGVPLPHNPGVLDLKDFVLRTAGTIETEVSIRAPSSGGKTFVVLHNSQEKGLSLPQRVKSVVLRGPKWIELSRTTTTHCAVIIAFLDGRTEGEPVHSPPERGREHCMPHIHLTSAWL